MLGEIGDFLSNSLSSVLQDILYATVYKLLYYTDIALCWIVGLFYKMFAVFAGVSEISYQDGPLTRKDYLLNYFFHHESIKNVYWDMAMIGVVLCFVFTIIAVIRKAGDLDGKQQRAYGQILRGTAKSVILILLMTAIITAVITATNVLMSSITTAFNHSDSADKKDSIVYTEDQYAAMARVLNTIGNYSLSTSSTSRYNLNACYNEIRPDLQWLKEQGVFDFYYLDTDEEGNSIESWQSALQKIVNAADLRYDLTMDVYNASISHALTDVMETINTNASFRPWSSYERKDIVDTTKTPMDTIIFLMGTSEAANNGEFNKNPSLTDNLRGPYYAGDKSIYKLEQVSDDFDIAVGKLDHIIIIAGAIKIIFDLATCVLNAVARIFNLLLLYLIAPLAISTSPMDDGGKFKQWTIAFVIQCFGILGIVISMRLLILYMPIISNSNLQLFDDPVMNLLGKMVLLLGGTEAAKRANGLITGILADNAGWQSIQAGDMSGVADRVMGKATGAAGAVVGAAADISGVSGVKQRVSDSWKRMSERGGILGEALNTITPNLGQTGEERAADRNHDFSQRMGWDKGGGGSAAPQSPPAGDSGSAGGSDFAGGDTTSGAVPSQTGGSESYDAEFHSGNTSDTAVPSGTAPTKTMPPINSQQYSNKYHQAGGTSKASFDKVFGAGSYEKYGGSSGGVGGKNMNNIGGNP